MFTFFFPPWIHFVSSVEISLPENCIFHNYLVHTMDRLYIPVYLIDSESLYEFLMTSIAQA